MSSVVLNYLRHPSQRMLRLILDDTAGFPGCRSSWSGIEAQVDE